MCVGCRVGARVYVIMSESMMERLWLKEGVVIMYVLLVLKEAQERGSGVCVCMCVYVCYCEEFFAFPLTNT